MIHNLIQWQWINLYFLLLGACSLVLGIEWVVLTWYVFLRNGSQFVFVNYWSFRYADICVHFKRTRTFKWHWYVELLFLIILRIYLVAHIMNLRNQVLNLIFIVLFFIWREVSSFDWRLRYQPTVYLLITVVKSDLPLLCRCALRFKPIVLHVRWNNRHSPVAALVIDDCIREVIDQVFVVTILILELLHLEVHLLYLFLELPNLFVLVVNYIILVFDFVCLLLYDFLVVLVSDCVVALLL